jgi:hypothetical protein
MSAPKAAPAKPRTRRPWTIDQVEDAVKVLILIAVISAGLAASFTHMHDWTMAHMPDDFPGWFGWANAVISELVPLACFLTIRRRIRDSRPYGYPLVLLIAGAVLSMWAQVAAVGAQASNSGKFLAVLPALAFMALAKMVLSDLDAARKRNVETEKRRADEQSEISRLSERLRAAEMEIAARRKAEAEAQAEAETERRRRAEAESVIAQWSERAIAAETARQQAVTETLGQATQDRRTADQHAAAAREAGQRLLDAQQAAQVARAAAEDADRKRREVERDTAAELGELRRQLAELQARPARQPRAPRAEIAAAPVTLPDGTVPPIVDTVAPATVVKVLVAKAANQEMDNAQLAALTGISDRTIRKVINALPVGNGSRAAA